MVTGILTLIAFSMSLVSDAASGEASNTVKPSLAQTCTTKSAKAVSFRYVDKYADRRRGECIRTSGYIHGQMLRQDVGGIADGQEPDWRTIGLDLDWEKNTLPVPNHPIKYIVIGNMRDCGNANFPTYCHYIGGSIITVTDIRAQKRKRP